MLASNAGASGCSCNACALVELIDESVLLARDSELRVVDSNVDDAAEGLTAAPLPATVTKGSSEMSKYSAASESELRLTIFLKNFELRKRREVPSIARRASEGKYMKTLLQFFLIA
jgi:hypothetical protein